MVDGLECSPGPAPEGHSFCPVPQHGRLTQLSRPSTYPPRSSCAEQLAREHLSVRRNPLIAEAFHRTGAIEAWGRGTNRVIEACLRRGIPDPEFHDEGSAVTVTFKAEVVVGARDLVRGGHQAGTKEGLSPDQVQVLKIADVPRNLADLMVPSGRSNRTKFRDQVVAPLLETGLLEMTVPDKPRSSKQQYRITEAGRAALGAAMRNDPQGPPS